MAVLPFACLLTVTDKQGGKVKISSPGKHFFILLLLLLLLFLLLLLLLLLVLLHTLLAVEVLLLFFFLRVSPADEKQKGFTLLRLESVTLTSTNETDD